MQTSNDLQEFKYDDPIWKFIAEYSLSEVMINEEIGAELKGGSLFQKIHELGLSPECLKIIRETITGIAGGARRHSPGDRPNLLVHIRLFCQRMPADNLSNLERPIDGGWGFYLIERDRDFPNDPRQECPRVVELYLYKEGE